MHKYIFPWLNWLILAFNNLSVFNQFLADNRCRYRYFLMTDTNVSINTDADTDMVLADTDMIKADTDMIEANTDISISANRYIGLVEDS